VVRKHVSLQELNAADQDAFVEAIGFVFESSPWIAAQAWHERPFATLDDLHAALVAVMRAAPETRKLDLIRAHPDLAGKAAIAHALTPESSREQASVGLDRLSVEEFETFNRLNNAYRERFSFPFIICVREHARDGILRDFATRLEHSREQEIDTALEEIAKIARLRLVDALERPA
jgi:2-oxo-4-hydroxy-4-carboxy-5-ureidoimidazoline decarboxylase